MKIRAQAIAFGLGALVPIASFGVFRQTIGWSLTVPTRLPPVSPPIIAPERVEPNTIPGPMRNHPGFRTPLNTLYPFAFVRDACLHHGFDHPIVLDVR